MKWFRVQPAWPALLWCVSACASAGGASSSSSSLRASAEIARGAAHGDANARVHDGRAVRLAAEALRCMSARDGSAGCEAVAMAGCVPLDALLRASPAAIEQIAERLDATARGDGFSREARGALARWFDLGAAAVREARAGRSGARCVRAEACRARAEGNPAVDDLENAWRGDVRAAQQHAAFDALVAGVIDAEEMTVEIRATAWTVFAMRLESAANARPEVRIEAIRAVAAMQTVLDGGARDATSDANGANGGGPTASDLAAHEASDEAMLVQRARGALHAGLASAGGGGGVASLVAIAREIDASDGEMASASGNPCGE